MRCSDCTTDNPAAARFCSSCGKPLALRCPRCNADIAPTARFCSQCGTPLSTATIAPPPIVSESFLTVDGERRHLTVLFCDLVGSTGISAGLDPEQWRAMLAAYHGIAADAITRFDGHVAKYLGDGVMAFFGYPAAHDNDAERAVRAGLALLEAISLLNEDSARPKLTTRIGIDSGAVVVGTGAGSDAEVFGDVPNIAARVQAAADPGTVCVTEATYRLIPGLFIVEDRGAHALKGIDQPLQLYRILQLSGARGRL